MLSCQPLLGLCSKVLSCGRWGGARGLCGSCTGGRQGGGGGAAATGWLLAGRAWDHAHDAGPAADEPLTGSVATAGCTCVGCGQVALPRSPSHCSSATGCGGTAAAAAANPLPFRGSSSLARCWMGRPALGDGLATLCGLWLRTRLGPAGGECRGGASRGRLAAAKRCWVGNGAGT